MKLINLAGGPGSGKSTAASQLFAELKMEGIKAELVGEEAKDVIYDKSTFLLNNQVLITGRQWQRIYRLQHAGCEVAISDSPLIQGLLYIKKEPYYQELTALVRKLETLVPETYNVFVRRVKPYVKFGRLQTEEQARALDGEIEELIHPIWMEIDGNRHGVHALAERILKETRNARQDEAKTAQIVSQQNHGRHPAARRLRFDGRPTGRDHPGGEPLPQAAER